MKRTIVLGLTGSVATVLYEKLIKELQVLGDVVIILTEKAEHFVDDNFNGVKVFREHKEWQWKRHEEENCYFSYKWRKNDPVLHINLRDRGSVLVIAPCSANTLGKMANGICDNLLTSVARAWDTQRPVIIAPAMNSYMWEHPVTNENITKLRHWGYRIVEPQEKMLACGTFGNGALADIENIVERVKTSLQWALPIDLSYFSGIPIGTHPGAFACQRKHEKHTWVDLYCEDGTIVRAVESGRVVGIEKFTGEWDGTPWWNNTSCVLVEGPTGVICYGEINPNPKIKIGDKVSEYNTIGAVKQVLKEGKHRHDIPGHSTSMLHMELYAHGTTKASQGFETNLLHDPTPFLLEAVHADRVKKLEYIKV